MCVTNTTYKRVQALSLAPSQVGVCPSALSQRLLGTLPVQAPQQTSNDAYVNNFQTEKPRPKRRRKPQKPGKTAKMNDRHFVVHNYHDHAMDPDENDVDVHESSDAGRRRGGVSVAFPTKLHSVLEQVEVDGLAHVISWQPHGRCFVIHKPKEFVDHVMPKYFRQTKLTSFQRQLNLYGFARLTRGADAGGYYHELFLRGKDFLCKKMVRTKVKGTRFKAASSPEQEPDFYTMPPVVVTPPGSDEEMSYDSSHRTQETGYGNMYAAAPLSMPYASAPVRLPQMPVVQPFALSADPILDEAVDELFLHDAGEQDNLADFVNDWDPTNTFGDVLEDDVQLGYMLDKLLED